MRVQLRCQRGRAIIERGIYLPIRTQYKSGNVRRPAQGGKAGLIGGEIIARAYNLAGQGRIGIADTLQISARLLMQSQNTKPRWLLFFLRSICTLSLFLLQF